MEPDRALLLAVKTISTLSFLSQLVCMGIRLSVYSVSQSHSLPGSHGESTWNFEVDPDPVLPLLDLFISCNLSSSA